LAKRAVHWSRSLKKLDFFDKDLLQLIDIERCLFDRMFHAIGKRSSEGIEKRNFPPFAGLATAYSPRS
jgi:hypothetical protein